MAPSDHRAKRQYNGGQSTITKYFSPAPNTQLEEPTPSFPVQTGQIQSDLLSVGMRVRKAVPEGYKTGTYSALSIFHDTTSAIPSEADVPKQVNSTPDNRPVFGSNIRELAPFCGLNKVGGFAQQISAPYELCPSMSSQESNISLESTGAGKRRFDDNDGEEATGIFSRGNRSSRQYEEEISPRSKPTGPGSLRAMAVPKTRKKRMDGWEQENLLDFDDAPFLDYTNLSDSEVDMSGV